MVVNRRTLAPFMLYLDEAYDARLEFPRVGFENGESTNVTHRQLAFDGWQTIEQPMWRAARIPRSLRELRRCTQR